MMGGMAHRRRARWISAAAALWITSCASSPAGSDEAEELADQPVDALITVSSPAFAEGEPIPPEFSCDGDEVSPALSWEGVPGDAVELALVVDDPDARGGTYVHWVLFGLDPSLTDLQAGVVPTGGRQAENSSGDADYTGPCPPGGDSHNYRFTVYALNKEIGAADGASAGDVLGRVRETAIAQGTLTGTYER
jgi:Raf kinase inhibitor-like YbhB/YbcL family protein